MYGLLTVRNLYLGNKVLTKPAEVLVQSYYLCSFCKFYHQEIFKSCQQLKYYSTTVKPSEINVLYSKKIKRNNGKFLELLEVTDAAAKNRRTKVKTLNAENLSEFVKPNEVNLIQNKSKRKYKRRKSSSELVKELKRFLEQEKILEVKKENNVTKKIKRNERIINNINNENNFSEAKINADENELRWKNEIEDKSINLFAFFQTCLNCEKGTEALKIFLRLEENSNPQLQNAFKNVRFHNLFLKHFATNADFNNLVKIKGLMEKYSIRLTAESYAYIFECVAKLEDQGQKIDFLRQIKKEMHENEISLNDVLTRPTFVNDQFENILKIARILNKNFTPNFPREHVNYSCPLLNDIYVNRNFESPAKNLFQLSDLKERAKKQYEIESFGDVEIKNISMNIEATESILEARREFSNLEKTWQVEVSKAFERNLKTLKVREYDLRITDIHPYLSVMEPEIYVNAIIKETKYLAKSTESFSPPISYLSKQLALSLFEKYEQKIQDKLGVTDDFLKCYDDYCEWYLEGGYAKNSRIKWQYLEHELKESGKCSYIPVMQWPEGVLKGVGKFLYDIILKDLKVNITSKNGNKISVPAFYVIFRSKIKQVIDEIQPHPLLTKIYRECQLETLTFNYDALPSISPPKPWYKIDKGGYLINKSSLIRVPYSFTEHLKRIRSRPKEKMYPLFDSLNQLGSIPWRVNTKILDVAMKVFQDGGSKELNVPEPPSSLPQPPPVDNAAISEEERRENTNNIIAFRKKKNEMFSLWCEALYKLSLANHYRNETFWLPHNMDFRGRVYPIPPHLSHFGSDFSRSMLIFAQEKPLGPKGLDWLKIHTINLTGFKKKESIKNRLEYANEILDKILDSAKNPLTGEMWWTTSDEPWQTLAACMEISRALECENPCEYLTGFPVHQDGSCNGLQHYAALGRDQVGAESVNLFPFENPRDVYSDVVERVEEARRLDAEKNVEIAKVLENHVQRKVIKQTIMTTVYGVTRFGAKSQIMKQLKDLENFPQNEIRAASSYLVEQSFRSLRTMFTSAREIQDWFTECAKVICTLRKTHVEWETPLGLPIVQPYYKRIATNPKNTNMLKQKNAFPPNFIHSLDSTHMMLTSLHSEQAGITFMSVHDCFWTHPSTVTKMNTICRKQFIALHSEPILENLSQFLLNKFQFSEEEINECKSVKNAEICRNFNKILSQVPKKGTYDINNIKFSTYFFS
ncbi:DNA-directed RNA polymerase, mitochondrial [Leptopilina heterotoma]|uniref:DNA-directed RNA polymerase, mitochondrial n=1 Tax=Leptopilina heterotoma TaxID=63436 RepID=UPI001CA9FF44|nr:DNA-directed RNA polymerase, mitochondrial [Leptopilina heterotoma]